MYKKLFVSLFGIIFAFMLGINVYAAGRVDTERAVKLTVSYSYDDAAVQGAKFSVYRVASVSAGGAFTLVSPFNGYSVSLDDIAKDEGRTLAQTLAAYAERDNIAADYTAVTNANGVFEVSPSKTGMYLVIGEDKESGNYIYMAEPFLIALPNKVAGEWTYDVTALPKSDRTEKPHGPGSGPSTSYVSVHVKKTWQNDSSSVRPNSIEVQLLHDGEVIASATLDSAGGWEHTWEKLEDKGTYMVAEKSVPKNYTVSVDKDGNSYEIINKYTYIEPTTEATTEHVTKEPEEEPTTRRSVPPSSGGGGGGGTPSNKAEVPNRDDEDVPGKPDEENPEVPPDEVPDLPDDVPDLPDDSDFAEEPGVPDDDYDVSVGSGTNTDTYNDNTTPNIPSDSVTDAGTPKPSGIITSVIGGGEPTLPQTGQLWWPVPVMGVSGMMLFAVGCIRRGKREEEDA